MENLKIQIKIEDNDNLKEAHDLLLKLGFSTYNEESFGVWDNCPKPIWLKTNCFDDKPNKIDWVDSGDYKPLKEITLPELRDLVVLKRNDVGDATHVDQYAEIEKVRQSHRTASEIADSALKHIRERAETYDQPTGERSAAKTAKAFNAITGKDITESEVWLLLQLLKDVRQWSREDYHQDSAEDCIAYAALKAESLEGGE